VTGLPDQSLPEPTDPRALADPCGNCGGVILYGYTHLCPDQMPTIYSAAPTGLPVGPAGTVASPKPQPVDIEHLLAQVIEKNGGQPLAIMARQGSVEVTRIPRHRPMRAVSGPSLEAALRAVLDQEETDGRS
jgi:hypothetical protein